MKLTEAHLALPIMFSCRLLTGGICWSSLPPCLPCLPACFLCSGLHFLAVMADEESELTSGLWLLLDRKPPNV
jgi:hypothetical protein